MVNGLKQTNQGLIVVGFDGPYARGRHLQGGAVGSTRQNRGKREGGKIPAVVQVERAGPVASERASE